MKNAALVKQMLVPVIGKVSGHDRSPVFYKVLNIHILTPVVLYQQQLQHVPYP